jgi:predicted ABC-type exoprotein transport system permease subunit
MSSQSRQHAIHRIRARRHFAIYLVFYLALMAYFVAEWARSDGSDFWPVWPLLGGGIGLAAQASHLFGWQLPITEERIEREINRST